MLLHSSTIQLLPSGYNRSHQNMYCKTFGVCWLDWNIPYSKLGNFTVSAKVQQVNVFKVKLKVINIISISFLWKIKWECIPVKINRYIFRFWQERQAMIWFEKWIEPLIYDCLVLCHFMLWKFVMSNYLCHFCVWKMSRIENSLWHCW